MRLILVVFALALASSLGAASANARPVRDCGQARVDVRNGNQLFVAGAGPNCLYRAFTSGSRDAVFTVTIRGVDTAGSIRFSVVAGPRDRVVVTGRNRVFGSDRLTTWSERCGRLERRAQGIAVTRCTGRAGDYLLSPPGAPVVPASGF